MCETRQEMDLLSLPVVMIENIISYLPYDEIAKDRLVCKEFNEICMRMLNRGFLMIERRHAIALKTVKAQLPRRESERRHHPLSRHCDILSSIETRISMLNMTYSKFIDSGMCCFIPGKVIDEIKRVLQIVESSTTPPRAHEVLQELRDISSMAIEHFDDKVSPALRKKLQDPAGTSHCALPRHDNSIGPFALKQELVHIRRRSILNAKLSLYLASQYKKFYKRMLTYKKLALRQRKTIRELTSKQTEQDAAIADLKRRIEECDIKYSELTHTNQAAGGKAIAGKTYHLLPSYLNWGPIVPSVNWNASSASSVVPGLSTQPRHFASQIKLDLSVLPIGTSKGKLPPNIKPRKPVIKLPSFSEDPAEPTPKVPKLEAAETDRLSPVPTTSQEAQRSLKDRTQTTMAKIRDFAKEIRNLTKSSDLNLAGDRMKLAESSVPSSRIKGAESNESGSRLNKRSNSFSVLDEEFCGSGSKKQKID